MSLGVFLLVANFDTAEKSDLVGKDEGYGGRRAVMLQARQPRPIFVNSEIDADTEEEAATKAANRFGVPNAEQSAESWGGEQVAPKITVVSGAPEVSTNVGGEFGEAIKNAFGTVAQQIAGNVVDSVLSPRPVYPLTWRKADDAEGKGYESTTTVTVPRLVPSPGRDTAVQLNTKIVFPRPPSTSRTIVNPCARKSTSGCSGGETDMFTEKDMSVRLDAVRKRADERLADARRNWEDQVLSTKQRFRERIQSLKQRSDAIANQIRRLEAGGGKRMDLPQYVRVRNRVAGVSDAVAKLIADENLLQTRIDHVLEAPGPR